MAYPEVTRVQHLPSPLPCLMSFYQSFTKGLVVKIEEEIDSNEIVTKMALHTEA